MINVELKKLKKELEKNEGKRIELKISFKGQERTITGTLKEIGFQNISIEINEEETSIIPLAPKPKDQIIDVIKEIKINGEVIFSQE